jgi:hypothetical protein
MDKYQPQSSGMFVKEGHEEVDFSIRGIVLFIVILVLSAILTFLAASGLMRFFEWGEKKYIDKKPTPVQKQLSDERGGEPVKKTGGVKPLPDWYDRATDEATINRTFATPRLQNDDLADMNTFRKSENARLNNTGKDPDGTIHIPISKAIDLLSKEGLPAVNGTFRIEPPLAVATGESRASTHTPKSNRGMKGDVSH